MAITVNVEKDRPALFKKLKADINNFSILHDVKGLSYYVENFITDDNKDAKIKNELRDLIQPAEGVTLKTKKDFTSYAKTLYNRSRLLYFMAKVERLQKNYLDFIPENSRNTLNELEKKIDNLHKQLNGPNPAQFNTVNDNFDEEYKNLMAAYDSALNTSPAFKALNEIFFKRELAKELTLKNSITNALTLYIQDHPQRAMSKRRIKDMTKILELLAMPETDDAIKNKVLCFIHNKTFETGFFSKSDLRDNIVKAINNYENQKSTLTDARFLQELKRQLTAHFKDHNDEITSVREILTIFNNDGDTYNTLKEKSC